MRTTAGRQSPGIEPALRRLIDGRHHDPFELLGRHSHANGPVVRALLPGALEAWIIDGEQTLAMTPVGDGGLFEHTGNAPTEQHYRIGWRDRHGQRRERVDPYTFAPQLSDFDLYLFGEGRHRHAWHLLGAHLHAVDGIDGTLFSVWAPNAERVSVIGDFNDWDGHAHPMRIRYGSGVWELFIPSLGNGALYKFSVRNRDTGQVVQKADPYGNRFEVRPNTASIICAPSDYEWTDTDWLAARRERDWLKSPMSIYEVHLGSWRRGADGGFLNYRELAHRLVDYVLATGFTHIELLPVAEHPFDASWGYQTTGYYAPTSRHGSPDDFRYFVDHCHSHDIGVLLDWAPAHFPRDSHALARFDGTALYEHADPRRGEHRDWGTLIYNYGRREVKNFLLANANYWLEEFHIDGLRVDAVASMLYLDYSRNADDWTPNIYGGNENLEAIEFIREINELTHGEHPGTLIIAEESTAWPQVTRPVSAGGLGFSMKWNMGWMHDTLEYFAKDPLYRKYHHNELTFGLLYAFTENFVLPFSHDEVVHGKGSMINKMPGDDWQRFANLRLLYSYMFTYPGTRLMFMGSEFGQQREWAHQRELDWDLLEQPRHAGLQRLVGDLNRLYRSEGALHHAGFEATGFEWIDCHDAGHSLLSYLRLGGGERIAVVLNFTPVVHRQYRLGVPVAGRWQELFNSDSQYYGGSNTGNPPIVETIPEPWMGRPHQLQLAVPPLGAIVLKHVSG